MEDATKFVYKVLVAAIIVCGGLYFLYADMYHHDSPSNDCSGTIPYDYPVCHIDHEPQVVEGWSDFERLIGSGIAGILMLFLVWYSYHSCINTNTLMSEELKNKKAYSKGATKTVSVRAEKKDEGSDEAQPTKEEVKPVAKPTPRKSKKKISKPEDIVRDDDEEEE